MRLFIASLILCCNYTLSSFAYGCELPASVCLTKQANSFALIQGGKPATIYIDSSADSAVQHVANNFAADIGRVGGTAASVISNLGNSKGNIVVIGVLGQSPLIDDLVSSGKLKVEGLAGQWEAFQRVVVESPFPNVPKALVIIGSDRRGTVYGTYDISENMGVSPWYWFADVPVQKKSNVFVTQGSYRDAPKVKYRGIFINDEDPGFSSWAKKHYGGINSKMYEHVFELLLRMKANYLWPAMWPPKAFNDDDPQNKIVADAMGIVVGASHHEPMTRAHDEWHRNTDKGVTGGKWDYGTNAANLRTFWRGGIERMMSKGKGQAYDSLVTVGMRGDGDEAMSEGTATQLLETIVADQRKIIAEVTGKPADQTPQVWALYKEVQDYYDHGMKVPDDVTLLFADDNWGQIRRLPTGELNRKGGYGVYYHFDYVGAPRNYKWTNTVQIEKTWQQMDLAYERGARNLWIVNVGDIKPLEFPISFFMKQAWNPSAMTLDVLKQYPNDWARTTFGSKNTAQIADLMNRYSQYAARKKPELIDATSFRLGEGNGSKLDGGEFGFLVAQWDALEKDMLKVKTSLPANQQSAYFQLIEYPIASLSNLYKLYYAVAWNRRLATAEDARANVFADQAEAAFSRDKILMDAYHQLEGGKWDGMMSQTHIGYTNWQQPEVQTMPAIKRVQSKAAATPIVFAEPTKKETGLISIEAPNFSRAVNGAGLTWKVIPNLGRTFGAVTAFPQGQKATTQQDAVRIEYDIDVKKAGDLTLQFYLSPTLDTTGRGSLRLGVSVDDAPMQILVDKLLPAPNATTLLEQANWNRAVENNARMLETSFVDISAGKHTIKVWRLDDNVVLQKLVASTQTIPLTFLGSLP